MLKVTLKPDVVDSPNFASDSILVRDYFLKDNLQKEIYCLEKRGKGFVYIKKTSELGNIPAVMIPFVKEVLWEKYFDLSCGEVDVDGLKLHRGSARAVFKRVEESWKVVVFSKSFEDFLAISSVVKGIIERSMERFEYKQIQGTNSDLISQKEVLARENERYGEMCKKLEDKVTFLKELVEGREGELEEKISQVCKERDNIQAELLQAQKAIAIFEKGIVSDFLKRSQE